MTVRQKATDIFESNRSNFEKRLSITSLRIISTWSRLNGFFASKRYVFWNRTCWRWCGCAAIFRIVKRLRKSRLYWQRKYFLALSTRYVDITELNRSHNFVTTVMLWLQICPTWESDEYSKALAIKLKGTERLWRKAKKKRFIAAWSISNPKIGSHDDKKVPRNFLVKVKTQSSLIGQSNF